MTRADVERAARRWLPHLAGAAVLGVLLVWDRQVFDAIHGFRSAFFDWLTSHVAQLRGAAFPSIAALAAIAVGIAFKKRKLRRIGTALVITIVLAGGLTTIMKEVIARPGPQGRDVAGGRRWFDERYGRFPSSHAAVAFGAAGTLAAFVPASAPLAYLFATLVSHERLYRGAHFPSDIFAGFWIGLIVARFVVYELARRGWADDLLPRRKRSRGREESGYGWANRERGSGGRTSET